MVIWEDTSMIKTRCVHGYRFKKINLLICCIWLGYVLKSDDFESEPYFKLRSVELEWKKRH